MKKAVIYQHATSELSEAHTVTNSIHNEKEIINVR